MENPRPALRAGPDPTLATRPRKLRDEPWSCGNNPTHQRWIDRANVSLASCPGRPSSVTVTRSPAKTLPSKLGDRHETAFLLEEVRHQQP
jgi:hypothetical protein